MPWCPECKAEYRPEFATCVDCGAALVDDKPEPKPELPPSAWARFLAGRLVSVLFTAGLYVCLMIVLMAFTARLPQALSTSETLVALCIFGLVRGLRGFERASVGVILPWLVLGIICAILSWGKADYTAGLERVLAACLQSTLPPIISAYLGSQWKRQGIQYLIIWGVFTVITAYIPFAIQLIWP